MMMIILSVCMEDNVTAAHRSSFTRTQEVIHVHIYLSLQPSLQKHLLYSEVIFLAVSSQEEGRQSQRLVTSLLGFLLVPGFDDDFEFQP